MMTQASASIRVTDMGPAARDHYLSLSDDSAAVATMPSRRPLAPSRTAGGVTPAIPSDNLRRLSSCCHGGRPDHASSRITNLRNGDLQPRSSRQTIEQRTAAWRNSLQIFGGQTQVFTVEVSDLPADTLNDFILQAFTNTVAPTAPTFVELAWKKIEPA